MAFQRDWIAEQSDTAIVVEHPAMAPILRHLPGAPLLSVSDVANALGVSPELVRGWIEEGRVAATNLGATTRPYYKIHRESLVAFLVKRTM